VVDSEPGCRLRLCSHSPGASGDFPALPAALSWPVEVKTEARSQRRSDHTVTNRHGAVGSDPSDRRGACGASHSPPTDQTGSVAPQTSRRERAPHELPARRASGPRRSTAKPNRFCRRSATGSEVSASAVRAKRAPCDWSEVNEAGKDDGGECGAPAGQAGELQKKFARSVRDAVNRDSIASAIADQSLTPTGHDSAAGTAGRSPAAPREWEHSRRPMAVASIDHGREAAGDLPAGPALTIVARRIQALRSKATQRRRQSSNREA